MIEVVAPNHEPLPVIGQLRIVWSYRRRARYSPQLPARPRRLDDGDHLVGYLPGMLLVRDQREMRRARENPACRVAR